jgi:hypothetical protein
LSQAWQVSDAFIFEGTEEDKTKKRRKDFCAKVKKTDRKKMHFQTGTFTPFSARRRQILPHPRSAEYMRTPKKQFPINYQLKNLLDHSELARPHLTISSPMAARHRLPS